MSFKEELLTWATLKAVKEACESDLRSLSPYQKRVVANVNDIHRQQVTKNLADGGYEPRQIGDVVNPDDCFHVGDVIYHLQCTGMNLEAACRILHDAVKMTNTSIAIGEKVGEQCKPTK